MNLLLADGSPLYRGILQQGLGSDADVHLHHAASAAEALRLAATHDIQFYILAGQLPDGDGLQLARELRRNHAAVYQPIVLLTGSPTAELARQASEAGVTELFRKQDVEELVTFLRFYTQLFGTMACRVLYVEDANDQRLALAEHMRHWGMDVDAFASAEEAWQALQQHEYDLAVCDVVLGPGMSGARLINRIRRQPGRLGRMPILAVTAFDSAVRRIELFHFGIDDYITKPFMPIELKARVNTLLSRQRAIDQARAAAERTSRLKSEFLANMSHEIRTPMNAILGMLALARRRVADSVVLDQLDKAKHAADHLLSIINDILDLSKIEADQLTLEQTHFRLGEVIENVSSILAHKAAEKKLPLQVRMPPEIGTASVVGDPLRLGQILINLVGNAIKFTDSGSISVGVQALPGESGRLGFRCEVVDTGIGIAADDMGRLFNAFQQADGSMSRKYGGTGLGLSICKRLVEMMGGVIGVDSQPTVGSTFWFKLELPLAQGGAQGREVPSPAFSSQRAEARLKADYGGAFVLLVEDEPINQEVSRMLLEDVGLSVAVANDGVEALAMAQAQVYDLILMDMQMPRMNGIDATRAIRANSRNPAVPILAMTANAFDDDRQACFAAGMDDHISKPVDPDILYEALLRWLPVRSTSA